MRHMKPHQPEPSSKDQEANDWQTIRRLMPFLWAFKGRVIIAMSLLLMAQLASVSLPIVLKHIVDGLEGIEAKIVAVPIALLIAYGALRLFATLAGELRDVVFGKVTERAMREVALKVFRHLHKLDLDFHLSRRTGGLSRDIERGLNGISFLLRFMLFNIIPTLLQIAMVAGILMISYDIWYGIITLASTVIYITFSVLVTNWRTQFVRKANEQDSNANTRAVDSLLNYETVKYFANEEHEAKHYDHNMQRWEKAARSSRYSQAALNSGQAFIIAAAVMSMMWMATHEVAVSKTMTVGDLVLINAYMIQLFQPLNFLGFVYREIKRSLTDMGKMFGLLEKNTTIVDAPNAPALASGSAAVHFNEVHFAYNERPILQGVSFSIPAGHTVAVVGASGAGKSTLARLLFRFYDVQQGSVTIGEHDIREVTQNSLRTKIGVVPQDTVLFNDTLGYNIGYGDPDADHDAIVEATKLAHLEAFVERLPDGYDTMVGERGLKLSGGEKQRVAIARTILKKPDILIFDEATSSLDSASERAILTALDEVAAKRTTLVIAHRLSTVVDADNIVVLDKGQVVEQGTHQQLLAKGEHYAKLWALQQQESKKS